MPLPTDPKQTWPPGEAMSVLGDVQQSAAWWSGDALDLAAVHGVRPFPSDVRPKRNLWSAFWSRRTETAQEAMGRGKIHVPLAADMASSSAALLFAEPPELADPAPGAEDVLNREGMLTALQEAAETCAALGGVYLRPTWDAEVSDKAHLHCVHPDAAVPIFQLGRLVEVIFWRELERDSTGRTVWRHLELHSVGTNGNGLIQHALYRGKGDDIGEPRNLEDHPETASIPEAQRVVDTGIPGLDVRYVPNLLPNRRLRGSPHGRSDFQGTEGLMDALDEVYTSWMRDVRLGQSRIIVPRDFLDVSPGRGRGYSFSLDQEVFAALEIDPTAEGGQQAITENQFQIRSEDHLKTCLDLIERIVSGDYSPQSFGLHTQGSTITGVALRLRERKTWITRGRKRTFWQPPLEDIIEMLQIVERVHLNGSSEPVRPRLKWTETVGEDEMHLAQTIAMFRSGQAMSVYSAVKRKNPRWTEEEVQEEVKRIMDESTAGMPDPLGLGALP